MLFVLQYAQRAFMINEFTAGRWQKLPYPIDDPAHSNFVGQTLGNGVLSQYGFPGVHASITVSCLLYLPVICRATCRICASICMPHTNMLKIGRAGQPALLCGRLT